MFSFLFFILGSICGGQCCSNSTEIDLRKKATNEFERLLHHHTKSLRGILESTANLFQCKYKTNLTNLSQKNFFLFFFEFKYKK